jgi:hypothetical protein
MSRHGEPKSFTQFKRLLKNRITHRKYDFLHGLETVETVSAIIRGVFTWLKLGANEMSRK